MAQVSFLLIALCGSSVALAQDPFQVAGAHYHRLFENEFAQVARVSYGAHETTPVHDHPSTPTVLFLYVTDGASLRFYHKTGEVMGLDFERPPVKAGGIRFARGLPETHAVEYTGDTPMEYLRIAFKTEPVDAPIKDVRLARLALDPAKPAMQNQFENGQIRILRVLCPAGESCPISEHPGDPAIVVTLSGPDRGKAEWSPHAIPIGPLEQTRIELKTKPAHQETQVFRSSTTDTAALSRVSGRSLNRLRVGPIGGWPKVLRGRPTPA